MLSAEQQAPFQSPDEAKSDLFGQQVTRSVYMEPVNLYLRRACRPNGSDVFAKVAQDVSRIREWCITAQD